MTESRATTPDVVVTGGAGAIGTVLVHALVNQGHRVAVLDNLSSGRAGNLDDVVRAGGCVLHRVDLRDGDAIRPLVEGAESVWHLAANPDIRRGTAEPNLDFDYGTRATFNVLEAARKGGAKRFFFSSSSVVYGLPTVFPTPEEYGPLLPQSLYGASKLASEAQISGFCHSFGMRGFLFRFANIIGPGMTHGVIFDFFEKLRRTPDRLEVLGDGRQSKSYLRTDDCVRAMLIAGDRSTEPLTVLNLGTTDRVSAAQIAERVVAAHGGKARIEFTGGQRGWTGDIPTQLLAIDRIRRLGWSPACTSLEAVEQTVREMAQSRGL